MPGRDRARPSPPQFDGRSSDLADDGQSLAYPDAAGRQAETAAAPAQLPAQVDHDARHRRPERVAIGERPAVGVPPVVAEPRQNGPAGQDPGGERLVDLDDRHVVERFSRPYQRAPDRWY